MINRENGESERERETESEGKSIYLDDVFIKAKYIRLIVIQLRRRTRQASF
jgi:hypothetical protein